MCQLKELETETQQILKKVCGSKVSQFKIQTFIYKETNELIYTDVRQKIK